MRQPATIKDVAQIAGCGVASVSRVLNNTGPASAEMRDRVMAAVNELDFQFSEVGRSLQSSTTRTIGCVVPSIANPVYADAVQGAQDVFLPAGYQTLLICTNYDAEIETQAIRTLIAKHVDGLVLTVSDPETSEALAFIESRQVPHCLLFNMAPTNHTSWSVHDQAAAGRVADAFAENNHERTGFLALKFLSSDRARQRYNGFVEGCARNGMRKPALLEIDESNEDLTDLLGAFLQDNPGITGIFASNDFLALAAIRSARELSLDVPGDLSIVGFDGIGFGSMVMPSLATIVTDPRMLGGGAGETVLSMINGTAAPQTPSPDQTFHFRAGGSLVPLVAESKDDGKVAAFPPSSNPTRKISKSNRRDQNET
ncbi:MAG: LacI family DNA-binding transcriptional regulator [Boseongicola sp.]|nr:LacI family DNA-binding transcriptional regulator [Boseongicola sp.]MXX90305.1 LacI family DNA-binding transcriptional regulator [Boseongicola sp. SB0665_bin_10]MYG24753.1 LacI family DNA-binding transcriptional regulator [Boseongicola sp. SB0677_bin_26]